MEEYNAYVGLDVHKDTIAVAVAYPGREKAEVRGFVPNTKRSLMKLVRRLDGNGEKLLFCYEAGPCGYEVYRLIREWGHEFYLSVDKERKNMATVDETDLLTKITTLPKMLRPYFHRELLGDLARLAYESIKELMIEAVGNDKARPGVVAVPQTFGNVLNPHPHTHCLASRGLWDEKGQWLPVPYIDTIAAEKLFRLKRYFGAYSSKARAYRKKRRLTLPLDLSCPEGSEPALHKTILYAMVTHMKTTVELSDALLKEAKAVASRERTTLRAIVEEGLREVLTRRKRRGVFRLRKASFRGKGIQPGLTEGSWETVRDLIYEGRGA